MKKFKKVTITCNSFDKDIQAIINQCKEVLENIDVKIESIINLGEINKNLLPYKEIYQPKPDHPYEVSKLMCENIVRTYKEN